MNRIARVQDASQVAVEAQAARQRKIAAGPASEKQVEFIATLVAEKDLSDYAHAEAARRVASGETVIPKSSAHQAINELLALPKRQATTERPALVDYDVPAGRYALAESDGVTRFFVVDKPTEGRWAGRTFVKVQASDDLFPLKNRQQANSVLRRIAADPRAASLLYGRQIGSCGVCGRTLTDETSRANGIGPVCAEKTGW